MSLSLIERKIVRPVSLLALSAAPLLAQDAPMDGPPPMFGGNFMFIMIAMFAIIYFVMIRPEQKKQKARQQMLSALKKGDRVVTVGGIMGTIVNVKDSSYVIKSGDESVLEFTKSAVQNVLSGGDAAEK